jgi:sugar lactone lactonase YvrE
MHRLLLAGLAFLIPCGTTHAQDMPLSQILIDGEAWQPVDGKFKTITSLAGDRAGNLFIADSEAGTIYRWAAGGMRAEVFAFKLPGVCGLACSPEGKLFACDPASNHVISVEVGGTTQIFANGMTTTLLAFAKNGQLYCITPDRVGGTKTLSLFSDKGERKAMTTLRDAGGIVVTADGSALAVSGRYEVLAFPVGKGGDLGEEQPYFGPLRAPRKADGKPDEPLPSALTVDAAGRLYVASAAGVQVFDPTGRLSGVLSQPVRAPCTALAFAGKEGDLLYAVFGNRLFVRKLKAKRP